MPRHVHDLVIRALNRQRKALNGAHVLLLGVAAPLAVKDKIIVGASGGDSGVRDYVAALDATTAMGK